MTALWVLLIQTAASWFMAGFIWVMQLLHYPLYAQVGAAAFPDYERAHNRRFARLVGPGVLVALISIAWLVAERPAGVPLWMPVAATVLLAGIIASTVRYQAPAHGRLQGGFDAAVLRGLLRGNWVRTVTWTLIGALDLWMVHRAR